MILNRILKKFCSFKADSSVSAQNSEESSLLSRAKFTFKQSASHKDERSNLIKKVLSTLSIQELSNMARESHIKAEEENKICKDLDLKLDNIHREIFALSSPQTNDEAVKVQYKIRRNEKRKERDVIRQSLEAALEKSYKLSSAADKFDALLKIVSQSDEYYLNHDQNSENMPFSYGELDSFVNKIVSEYDLNSKSMPKTGISNQVLGGSRDIRTSNVVPALHSNVGEVCVHAI